jgi:hypothetical protein
VGDKGGVFISWDAAIFLKPLFVIDAFGAETVEEILAGFGSAGSLGDFLHQAFFHSALKGDGVETPTHRITLFFDLANDLIEDGVEASMR